MASNAKVERSTPVIGLCLKRCITIENKLTERDMLIPRPQNPSMNSGIAMNVGTNPASRPRSICLYLPDGKAGEGVLPVEDICRNYI